MVQSQIGALSVTGNAIIVDGPNSKLQSTANIFALDPVLTIQATGNDPVGGSAMTVRNSGQIIAHNAGSTQLLAQNGSISLGLFDKTGDGAVQIRASNQLDITGQLTDSGGSPIRLDASNTNGTGQLIVNGPISKTKNTSGDGALLLYGDYVTINNKVSKSGATTLLVQASGVDTATAKALVVSKTGEIHGNTQDVQVMATRGTISVEGGKIIADNTVGSSSQLLVGDNIIGPNGTIKTKQISVTSGGIIEK